MTEWLYKATPAKVPFQETSELALKRGFICRAAFKESGKTLNSNVAKVGFGDTIHLYFVEGSEAQVIGSFRVSSPRHHSDPEFFGGSVTKTCLREVKSEAFASELASLGQGNGGEGYEPDPQLGLFTGWTVQFLENESAPEFLIEMFPGQSVLVPHSV